MTRIIRKDFTFWGKVKNFVTLHDDESDMGKFLNIGDKFFPEGTGFAHEVIYKIMQFRHDDNCGGGNPCNDNCKWNIEVIVKKL